MRKTINVEVSQPGIWLDADITFAQVDGWCGHTTRDLKMSLLRHHTGAGGAGPMPLIVWICGGGWLDMDRNAHLPEFVDLARSGYVVASVDYRTSNTAIFPGPLEDVKAAIRYLRTHAGRFRVDASRVGVMGESAGGHLAGLVGVTGETRLFDVGDCLSQGSAVQAACVWYGPADFCTVGGDAAIAAGRDAASPEALLLGGRPADHPALAERANPITYVTENAPPFLLLHGNRDQVVPVSQSRALYKALCEHDVPVDFYEIDGAGHATAEFFQPQVKRLIQDFFDRTLKA